jgi:hypothetical protein
MIEKYLKDSIAEPNRKTLIETISKLNLIPEKMLDAMRERDSIAHAKNQKQALAKEYLKSIKDTTGIEDEDSSGTMDELNKPDTNERNPNSVPAKKQTLKDRTNSALLPEEQKGKTKK